MLVDIPFIELPAVGYVTRRVDMRLSEADALTLRSVFHGIAEELGEDGRTVDGKRLNTPTDAIRIMLERVRAAQAATRDELPVGVE